MLSALSEDLSKPPEHRLGLAVTQEAIDEATTLADACDAALQPANAETVVKWLTALGNCVVAPGTSEDARTKLTSYASILNAPPCCYTQGTLRKAAERFKWFPSVSELSELFAEIVGPIKSARFAAERVMAEKPTTQRERDARKRSQNPAFIAAMEQWEKTKAELAAKSQAAKG